MVTSETRHRVLVLDAAGIPLVGLQVVPCLSCKSWIPEPVGLPWEDRTGAVASLLCVEP